MCYHHGIFVKVYYLNEEMRRKSQGSSSHSDVLVTERQGRSKSRGPSNKDYDMVNLAHDDSRMLQHEKNIFHLTHQDGIGFDNVKLTMSRLWMYMSSVIFPIDGKSKLDVKIKPCVFHPRMRKETISTNDDPIDLDPVLQNFDEQFGDANRGSLEISCLHRYSCNMSNVLLTRWGERVLCEAMEDGREFEKQMGLQLKTEEYTLGPRQGQIGVQVSVEESIIDEIFLPVVKVKGKEIRVSTSKEFVWVDAREKWYKNFEWLSGSKFPGSKKLAISQELIIEKVAAQSSTLIKLKLVGSLMYAMVCTRPDLAHAVGVVSRFLSNPGKKHWEAVKWIFRYLRGGVFSWQEDSQKCVVVSTEESMWSNEVVQLELLDAIDRLVLGLGVRAVNEVRKRIQCRGENVHNGLSGTDALYTLEMAKWLLMCGISLRSLSNEVARGYRCLDVVSRRKMVIDLMKTTGLDLDFDFIYVSNLRDISDKDLFMLVIDGMLLILSFMNRSKEDASLWHRLIVVLYGNRSPFVHTGSVSSLSPWNCILKELNSLSAKGIDLLALLKKKVGNGANTFFWEDCWINDVPLSRSFPRLYALELKKGITVADKLIDASFVASFRRNPRGGVEEEQLHHLVELVGSISLSPSNDRWAWLLGSSGEFSVHSARTFIDDILLPFVGDVTRWVKVVPIKVNILAWKVCLDKLPTRLNLSLRGIDIPSIICPNCGLAGESCSHLFYSCNLARTLWRKIARWWEIDIPDFSCYEEWIAWFKTTRFSKAQKEMLEGVFYVMWWMIWKFRNQVLFGSSHPRMELLFDDIVWYLDDGTIIGDTLVIGKVLELIMKDGPRCGLHLNIDKTEVFEMAQRAFDAALCSALERIVTASGPGFGDCQWRLATLPFAFGGIVAFGPAFNDALCAFNTKMKTGLLSHANGFVAIQMEDHTLDWLRAVLNSGLGQTMNNKTYRCVLCYRLGVPLFFVSKPCSACSKVFTGDIYGDHAISWISARKEVDIGLGGECDKPLYPADMLLYLWDKGLDVSHRKWVKYEVKCADTGYGFLSFSFYSLGELEKDAVTLLKRIRKFSTTEDIGTRATIHIFNKISFAIAKRVQEACLMCGDPSHLADRCQSWGSPPHLKNKEVANQSHKTTTKSIAAFERQVGQLVDRLSKRDNGKLLSYTNLNPTHKKNGNEHVNMVTSLCSGNTYNNKVKVPDVHDLRSVETEFLAIVFNDNLTSNETLSCEPTVSSLNDNEIDFKISFHEFDDEDYTVVFDKNSFSYKIISTNDLKTDSKNDNDKVNMPSFPSPEPTVSCLNDLDFFKDFENKFPAIVYNDALTSKSDFSTEHTLSPQHIDEFDLEDETSLSECDKKEQNVLYFNDLFPFNVIYPDELKTDTDNDNDKVDIEHSSRVYLSYHYLM
ncbi:RNA-directed DNA polymerase, eukaryota [Tanacetum coccineum]